ncbi:LexA family protein [Streptomyces sp. NPDC054775]
MKHTHPVGYLGKRQDLIVKIIWEAIAEHGEGPTLREIAGRAGLGSIGSVHLTQLDKKGVIVREPWQPRSIRLTC